VGGDGGGYGGPGYEYPYGAVAAELVVFGGCQSVAVFLFFFSHYF